MKKIVLFLSLFLFSNPVFAGISLDFDDGIYHIVISGKSFEKKINFIAFETLKTNEEVHKITGSELTINTGFFDPKNQKTISHIVNGGVVLEDPRLNENLMNNPILRQNIDKIFNRTEFRVVECDDKYHYEITQHNVPVDFSCSIVTSAQGGPMLLPQLRLEEEFFIQTKNDEVIRESASALHKTARTLIGLKNQDVHIFIITNEHPMDIYESRDLCKKYELDTAMAFDGGSSTSFDYKNHHVISTEGEDADTGRRLKSFMIIKKMKNY